jgi:hypothetical protein
MFLSFVPVNEVIKNKIYIFPLYRRMKLMIKLSLSLLEEIPRTAMCRTLPAHTFFSQIKEKKRKSYVLLFSHRLKHDLMKTFVTD